jgi:hypothetical protein
MKLRVGGLLGAATVVAAIAGSLGSTGAAAAEAGTGCNVAGSNNLTFALFDGSQSVPPDQFQAAVNGLEQGYVEDLVKAKQIPDLMLGTFGSSARKAMQGLHRLTLQNVRNFERPPCAKRGLGILNYRLVQDWKRVRVGRGSAILEALYGVGGYMRAPTGDKKLMIYSDMLEDSAWQKFGPSIATRKKRTVALNTLAKSGHIATLNGVTVCIAGFDAGDIASKQPAAVKSYWQEYFRRAGAALAYVGTEFPTSGECATTRS